MQGVAPSFDSPHNAPIDITPAKKQELVDRVLNGHEFSRAPALRSFLVYVTKYAILGQPERLKEQVIGTEVFSRPKYDPSIDNIVRVRAHELRGRLKRHFESDGAEEPIVITIPKGGYVPDFVRRSAPEVQSASQVQAVPTVQPAVILESPELPRGKPKSRLLRWLPLGAAFLAAILVTAVVTQTVMRNPTRGTLNASHYAIQDFWGQFFTQPDEELRVVYADTSFGLWQDLSKKTLNLGEYLSHKYLDEKSDKLREIATRASTSPADVSVSVKLAAIAGEFHGHAVPQFARTLHAELLHRGKIVLIGSHRANPWVDVYEPNLNFQLDHDPVSGAPRYINRSPQPGEAKTYAIPDMLDMEGDELKQFPSFGLLALLRVCGEPSFVLLSGGLNMQATKAAGDLVTDEQGLDMLLHGLGHTPGTNVAPFEALIQMTSLPGGGYDGVKIIAFRTRTPGACVDR